MRTYLKILIVVLIVALVIVAVVVWVHVSLLPKSSDETVPSEYRSMYSSLKQTLDSWDKNLSSVEPVQKHQITFAAELLTANANRGTALLTPQAMQGVIANLNGLQSLGVTGVTVAVSYPLYTPGFPNYNEYVSFYKAVASEVHSRGLTLDVETGPIFTDTPFSELDVNYSGLTFDSYVASKRQMVQAIINDMHPDYVNLGTEPDTEYLLMNIPQFLSPDGYYYYVSSVLDGLNKQGTKIGAGIGAWDSFLQRYVTDPVAYVQRYMTDSRIDVITMHVYPIYGNDFNTMTRVVQLAEQHGKRIVIDEAWCSKSITPESSSIASDANIFRRDVYGFWAPVDEQFLKELVKFSNVYNVCYLSPFWSWYLFGYLNYSSSTTNLSYNELSDMVDSAAVQNMTNSTVSPTGHYYSQLIEANT